MSQRDSAPSDRTARLTGWLYLGTIVSGLFAEIGVRERIRDDSAAQTLANIMANPSLYRAGEAADLVMLICYVGVTALLYRLFAGSHRTLALVAAGFGLTGIAVLTVAGAFHLLPLRLPADLALAERAPIAQLALTLHGTLYGVSLVFFGIYCALIGVLCLASRLLPRTVGWLMIVGGLTHLATRFAWVLAPQVLAWAPAPIQALPLLGEAALALWLIAFGISRRQPT